MADIGIVYFTLSLNFWPGSVDVFISQLIFAPISQTMFVALLNKILSFRVPLNYIYFLTHYIEEYLCLFN